MTSMTGSILPQQFIDLESYCDKWDLPDFNSRYRERLASKMADLREFHDAMMVHGPAILDYLDKKPIVEFTDADRVLGRLMYALGVVAQAVEVFKQVRVPDTEATDLRFVSEFKL